MKVLNLAVAAALAVLTAGAASAALKSPKLGGQSPAASQSDLDKLRSQPASRDGANLYHKSNYRKAAAKFDGVLDDQPGNYRAAYMLGMSYLKRDRWESARDSFRRALELKPDRYTEAHIYNGLAYSYEAIGQTRMAHHHFHKACKANKSNAYSQAGAKRTEYRHRHEPEPRPVAKSGSTSKRSSG